MGRIAAVVEKVQDRLAEVFGEPARSAFQPWPVGLDVVALDDAVQRPDGTGLQYVLWSNARAQALVDALLVAEKTDNVAEWLLRVEALVQ